MPQQQRQHRRDDDAQKTEPVERSGERPSEEVEDPIERLVKELDEDDLDELEREAEELRKRREQSGE